MDRGYRLFTLAAAAGFTAKEFVDSVVQMRSMPLDEVERYYFIVRSRVRSLDDLAIPRAAESDPDASIRRNIANAVSSLLTRSGLTNSEGAARMLVALQNEGVNFQPETLSYDGKGGFRRWLDRVMRLAGPTATLNAASTAFAESSPNDGGWRLGEP